MGRPSRLLLAKSDIAALFEAAATKVYSSREFRDILAEHRESWRLPRAVQVAHFTAFLIKHGALRVKVLRATNYDREITRYIWGKASPYEVALSINTNAYLSHGTAALLHGLLKADGRTIHINIEQSKKPAFEGSLTQEGIDRAFAGNQRASRLVYTYGRFSIVQLAGKHTNRLGVQDMPGTDGRVLAVTGIERTLIDLVVRPAYAGGPLEVLKAYRAGKARVSTEGLIATLKELDYAYPYHQSIGLLMEKAGYPPTAYEPLRALGLRHDFHLAHRMHETKYSAAWRLHYPVDLP